MMFEDGNAPLAPIVISCPGRSKIIMATCLKALSQMFDDISIFDLVVICRSNG